MSILPTKRRADNDPTALPLFDYAERVRLRALPLAARMVRRRCRIDSPSTAAAIAELAGYRAGGDR